MKSGNRTNVVIVVHIVIVHITIVGIDYESAYILPLMM